MEPGQFMLGKPACFLSEACAWSDKDVEMLQRTKTVSVHSLLLLRRLRRLGRVSCMEDERTPRLLYRELALEQICGPKAEASLQGRL